MKELAGVIIRDDEGRLLLVHRNTTELVQWEIPGGKVEPGETHEEADVRESAEELAIDIDIVKHLGSASFAYDGKEWRYTWFEASIKDGHIPALNEPRLFDELRYWNMEDLESTNEHLSPNVINFMDTQSRSASD